MRFWLTTTFVGVWAVLVSVPIATSMAWHLVPLPAPMASTGSSNELPESDWQVVHFLAGRCPCSFSVASYLAGRPGLDGTSEFFVILGEDDPKLEKLLAASHLSAMEQGEQLAESLAVTGGPCMVVLSPKGTIAYAGGYSPQPPNQFSAFQDRHVWQQVRQGESPAPFPLFGCATAQIIRDYQDPFGVKRAFAK